MPTYTITSKKDGSNAHVIKADEDGTKPYPMCFTMERLGRTVVTTVDGDQGVVDYPGDLCQQCREFAQSYLDSRAAEQARMDREGRIAGRTVHLTIEVVIPETATLFSLADLVGRVERGSEKHLKVIGTEVL